MATYGAICNKSGPSGCRNMEGSKVGQELAVSNGRYFGKWRLIK